MNGGRKYYSIEEVQDAIDNHRYNELVMIPLEVGEYCSDRAYAEEICIMLLKNNSSEVRASAVRGISYIAKNHRSISENIKPMLLHEYENNRFYKEKIKSAIENICFYIGWEI